jgi:hypothetical protein
MERVLMCLLISPYHVFVQSIKNYSILLETKGELLNVGQQNGIFLFHLFPSVSRHDLIWKVTEEFGRFLQWLRWIEQIAVQKENNTNIGRHVMDQVVFAFVFQIIQQIFIRSDEKSSVHRLNCLCANSSRVNEAEQQLLEHFRLDVFNFNLVS